MSDCIFCKIRDGEIPSEKVHEDEVCYAINDINPRAKTHILLIPNKHIPSIAEMEDTDAETITHLIQVAKKIAADKELTGYKLVFNVGKDGGQEIFHVHLHLMAN